MPALVIVESPAKAKKIAEYLGDDLLVKITPRSDTLAIEFEQFGRER